MSALDRVEFHNVSVERALSALGRGGGSLHPGLVSYAQNAVRCYPFSAGPDGTRLVADRHFSVVREERGSQVRELYAWGRRYQSQDGRLREHRFLRFGRAGERERDPAQVALAAFTTACGDGGAWPTPWDTPFLTFRRAPAERVRVAEVGLADGSYQVLFDGSRAEAEAYYARYGRPRVEEILVGDVARPGAACVDCKLLTACSHPPRLPGLLGLTARPAPLRKVSASDLRYYQTCPAQAYLYSLRLPRVNEYGEAAHLGKAVHAWLEDLHRRPDGPPCRVSDLPLIDEDWAAGEWRLAEDAARAGARMLRQHLEICPLLFQETIGEVRVEPDLAFYDTAANAIVLAKPDLLYLDDGSWVWRETKTTQRTWSRDANWIGRYPQLALAIVLLARGALGGDPGGSRVELEILHPEDRDIVLLEPDDPETLALARRTLAELAEPWRADEVFAPRPGANCRTCPVSVWCPQRAKADEGVE
ncbi:PD-(D/E)XK nuclease superfamily protein [Streptoalloteichus tenebrarius]|uniref:PD-(D/E)XK nuclease superfamily protein n=1 Tax=Streptoalloteichus tenebrarius (strain ATCC 17920 / DSM 40477 / JCM 4838 / CBS 697.72 / NBRC 16177 / NCIMB 11028 / NRRL B-12390 / A12253. 1 / ISP 5477) TaxID=1933 RepID=A0ABT1I0S7_STRSD|nr:PD-(D/E)XK nuclease family protein [Streptoalloteichus tenebrarius]MCP2261364.1 PD-(D/E)XK nuclease superfamily protein [Streptoalloteichus tenebrarius]